MNRDRHPLVARVARWRVLERAGLVFVFVAALAAAIFSAHAATPAFPRVIAVFAALGVLLVRHRRPLGTLAVLVVLELLLNAGNVLILPFVVAVYTVATDCELSTALAAAAVSAAALVLSPLVHGDPLGGSGPVVSHVVIMGLAVAAGLYRRTRAEYVGGLHERAERLERERELLAEQAVAEERLRIARELHDVVAHNVSLMVVQAQAAAAGAAVADQPTTEMLGRIGDLGREALSEMSRMLGVLRVRDGHEIERAPQPGVRDLGQLIETTRTAGLDVSFETDGEPRELPPGVDLSVYRIAQEALTNVVRHAEAGHATVALVYRPESVILTVTDDGRGEPSVGGIERQPSDGGHGLVGMRERVALFGGELSAGTNGNGSGFRVRARIPLS